MQVTQQSAETNAAARAVQDGKEDILVLWLACRQYVMQQARRWYRAFEGRRGVALEDLEQAGFHEVRIHKKKGWLCVTARK